MKGSIVHELPRFWRFLRGQYTLEIGYPWLTLGAVSALERLVSPEHRVLELGAGGSTVFFARRCALVASFETNPEWAEKIIAALDGNENVHVTCAPLKEMKAHISVLADESFDIMLVDHADPTTRRKINRRDLAQFTLPKLRRDGWLVIDNYSEYGMDQFDLWGWDVWTFDDMRHTGRGTRICRRRDDVR